MPAYTTNYQDVVLADSPAGYWRLGDGSGLVMTDTSPNARHGSYAGGVTLAQQGPLVGDANGAVLLDGSTGYATVPDQAGLDLGDTVTIEAWIRLRTAGSTGAVLNKGATAYGLRVVAGVPTFAKSETADVVAATVNLDDLGWHHVVATKSTTTNVLYVDGVDRSGVVTNAVLADTAIDLQIGRLSGGTSFLGGYLDEVAVYPTALSAARVLAHFQAGRAIRAGVAAKPSRAQLAAVLVADGVVGPPGRARYASYGANTPVPYAAAMGVEVVTEAQAALAVQRGKVVVNLTRYAVGAVIPASYHRVAELPAE